MRGLIVLAAILWIGCFGWLFWSHEINRQQPWQAELAVLLVLVGLSIVLRSALRRRDTGADRQPGQTTRNSAPGSGAGPSRPASDSPAGAADRGGFEAFGGRSVSEMSIDEIEAALEAATGVHDRAGVLPGWALRMRSPWRSYPEASSWLGGVPKVPEWFDWPRTSDGKPLAFVMQIDLAALGPEVSTGQRPPGLPDGGALLVFVREMAHRIVLLGKEDMAQARHRPLPADAPPLSRIGFFHDAAGFSYWPVDPVAYLDRDGGRPDVIVDPFTRADVWLDSWGLAAYEADLLLQSYDAVLAQADGMFRSLRDKDMAKVPDHTRKQAAYLQLMVGEGGDLMEEVEAFRDLARGMPPEDPPSPAELAAVFAKRRAFADRIDPAKGAPYGALGMAADLRGRPGRVAEALLRDNRNLADQAAVDSVPDAYRGFLEMAITDWRGHRLFGRQTPPPFNTEDLRGQDCLFAIASDGLLGTGTEHFDGFSVWCDRRQMAKGVFEGAQLLWHSNG